MVYHSPQLFVAITTLRPAFFFIVDGLPQSIRDPGSPYSLLFSIAPLYIPSSVIKPVSSIISSLGMKSKGLPIKLKVS